MTTKPKTKSKPAATEPLEIAENQKAAAAAWNVPIAVLKLAKSQGCTAFKSGRVHRGEFLDWLKNHEAEAGQAVAVDLEKAERGELEKEKLRAQIILLRSRNERESRESIPVAEACAEWGRAVAIIQEECQILMDDRDRYRVFCERIKSRIGSMFQLTPGEMIAAIEKFYSPKPSQK
jgi:hypothetical protein